MVMKDYKAFAENQAPKRRVPAELNPDIFDAKVGFSEDERDPVLNTARQAFSICGEKLKNWHEREAVIFANKYEMPAKKNMLRSKMVRDELPKRGEVVGKAQRQVDEAISDIDKNLDKAFRQRLPREDALEIRTHLKGMSKDERRAFLADADDEVLSAALAAKPFLSGLAPAEAARMRYDAIVKWYPDQLARRERLETAKTLLASASELYLKEAQDLIDPELDEFEVQSDAAAKALAGE